MKRVSKKRILLTFMMLMFTCLCWGCKETSREAAAEYTAPEDDTEERGTDADNMETGGMGAEADRTDADTEGMTDIGEGDSAADDVEDGISGNSAEAAGSKQDMADGTEQEPEITEEEETGKPRREPVKVKGIYVSGPVAGIARMDELIELVDQTELNAMVIDIKNDEGRITYDMQSDQVLAIQAGVRYIPDIEALVSKCKEKDIYLIARIVAFRDPYLAEQKPEWAVHTKEGDIFRDKSGLAWVNPYQREVWDYLVEIAKEAALVGFDEVQFDYIRFSTDIKADEVDYGPEAEEIDKIEIITEFTEYLYEQIAPTGVYVAADVFGTVIENETDQAIVGQDYVKMAEHLDYICPMIYPSHYRNGSYGIKVPDADPYNTIFGACSASVQELEKLPEENRAHVRAWLQSFTASWVPGHISYGPQQIRAQIKGAYDAGYDEWILWNAAVKYQRDSLLTEEEAEEERARWEAERQENANKEDSTESTQESSGEEMTTPDTQTADEKTSME